MGVTTASLQLADDGRAVAVRATTAAGSRVVARYVYLPQTPAQESPRPYLHPVTTLLGTPVTGFRPEDHRWHHGLSLALPYVGPANLWGGPTWVSERSRYERLPVNGSMRHRGFTGWREDGFTEALTWHDADGAVLAQEQREVTFALLNGGDESGDGHPLGWRLRWRTQVTSAVAEPLRLGSPATRGRAGAGYAGVFWRADAAFADGEVRTATAGPAAGEDLMGARSPWMAMTTPSPRHAPASSAGAVGATVVLAADAAAHDPSPETGPGGTVERELADGPRWFARTREYPGFGPAPFAFREQVLAPGAPLELAVTALVVDGELPRDLMDRLTW